MFAFEQSKKGMEFNIKKERKKYEEKNKIFKYNHYNDEYVFW